MANFIADTKGRLVNLDEVKFTEYLETCNMFKVTDNDNKEHIVERMPYTIQGLNNFYLVAE